MDPRKVDQLAAENDHLREENRLLRERVNELETQQRGSELGHELERKQLASDIGNAIRYLPTTEGEK